VVVCLVVDVDVVVNNEVTDGDRAELNIGVGKLQLLN
jgi:hypothetical protein